MNIKVAKKELLDALTIASKAVSSTTPLPVLASINMIVKDETLTLIASDSNISIKTVITTDNNVLTIEEEGEIVLDARYSLEIFRKVDSEYINIEVIDGSLVKISGGTVEYKINGIKASEYPNISFNITGDSFSLKSEDFISLVNKTIFACSDKETRPVLTGVNLKTVGNKLTANATDSFRFAYKEIEINDSLNINITIPAKYLLEVSRSIVNEEEIKIAIDSQQIFFIFGNTIIKTRLFDDIFPDTSKFIPSSFTHTLKIDSKELLNQLDRTSFIKTDGKSVVRLSINNEFIEINCYDSISSFYGKMSVISFEGEPFEISCSSKYLTEAIKAIGSDVVTLYFSGELKPIILKNDEDQTLLQLISPVRTYK